MRHLFLANTVSVVLPPPTCNLKTKARKRGAWKDNTVQIPETRTFLNSPAFHPHSASTDVSQSADIIQLQIRMCAQSLQSCLMLCDSINCSPLGFSVHRFSRQEYCSGLPCPPPEGLPNQGIKPESLMSPTLAGGFFTTRVTWEAPAQIHLTRNALQTCLFCHQSKTTKIW